MNKSVIVRAKDTYEAVQWFRNGDHPKDDCFRPFEDTGKIPTEPREGKIVRYFRRPDVDGQSICKYCGQIMHVHGWIDSGYEDEVDPNDPFYDGNYSDTVVCPGDWIIGGYGEEHFRVSQECFKEEYEIVKEK